MKNTKRILARLLAGLMLFTCLPFTAFAAGDDEVNLEDRDDHWSHHVTSIEYPEEETPAACAEWENGECVLTEWYFPGSYSVTLSDGETMTVEADNEIDDPFDGQYFDFEVSDTLFLSFNAYMYYDSESEDVVLRLCQMLPDEADEGNYLDTVWSIALNAEISGDPGLDEIADIDFADEFPSATLTDYGHYYEISDWYFPEAYNVILRSGEVITVPVSNDIKDPYDGQWFEVVAGDNTTHTFNAYMVYDEETNETLFVMAELIEDAEGDGGYLETLWTMVLDADVVPAGFFARLAVWFRSLMDSIRNFFGGLFGDRS